MFSFTVRLTFEQEDHEKVAEILVPADRGLPQEPGCVSYIPHFVEGEPHRPDLRAVRGRGRA